MTRFIEIAENPAPAGAEAQDFIASDGAQLRVAFFPAEGARATVVLAPGWAEFIEKYFEVVDELRVRRFNVAIMDWRGQGLSAPPASWNGYFARITRDLKEFRDGPVAARFPGPCFLLTHSMGGLPALLLLGQGDQGFVRAALCAPLTRLFPPLANVALGAAASAVSSIGLGDLPAARGGADSRRFEGNMFSSDPARHERFRLLQEKEPAATCEGPAFGWVREAMRASAKIHETGFFDRLKTPVLIVSAGLERRIDGGDHARIASRHELIEHVEIPGALHEIMMERDELRAAFWKEVDDFFAPAL